MSLIQRPSTISRPTAPEAPPDLRGLRSSYQPEGVRWLRARRAIGRNALLGDEMGLGKTAQALRALPDRARGIVICPASVTLTWEEETRAWRRDLRATTGEALRVPGEREIVVCSYDSLPDLDPRSPSLVEDDLSSVVLILDEAHRAKGGDALRTQKVRRLVRQCGAAWGLTGTPMVGTPKDLLGLLLTLDLFDEAFPGGRDEYDGLCGSVKAEFWDRRARKMRTKTTWGAISPEVSERLKRVMLRRLQRDHLDRAASTWVDVPCPAPADLREHLDDITAAWDRYDPRELPPFELYSAATAALARSRADLVRDLAADVSRSRPTLVFSAHLAPIDAAASLPGAGRVVGEDAEADRRRAIGAFRGGRSRVLGLTYGAGGVGLNLPEAGAAILADLPYTPAEIDQALDRARGAAAYGGLAVYRMVSDHPLDRRIRQIVDEKRRMIREAVDRT